MRAPWLVALAALALPATLAEAQTTTYRYTARTVAPVARTGAVTAGSLTWQCAGSECTITGQWPAPGVAACAALARQVGRIASYGRAGAMLTSEQITRCNAGLAAAPTVQAGIPRPPPGATPTPPPAVPISPTPVDYAATLRTAVAPFDHPFGPSGLNWSCDGNHCNAHFAIVDELVATCRRLLAAVLLRTAVTEANRITSFRRGDEAMSAAQLTECNGVTSQVALEPGGRPQDLVEHVLVLPSIRFYGASAPLPAPALPSATRIESGLIVTPGVRLQASAPGATPTPRGSAPEGPSYLRPARTDVTVRIPVSLRDMPAETLGIELNCLLSIGRYVPFAGSEVSREYRDLYTPGWGFNDRIVATGGGSASIRSIGAYEAVFDVPLQLRPFYRLQDARSYHCAVQMRLARSDGRGIERRALYALADRTASESRAGFYPAAGTTPLLRVEGNLQ